MTSIALKRATAEATLQSAQKQPHFPNIHPEDAVKYAPGFANKMTLKQRAYSSKQRTTADSYNGSGTTEASTTRSSALLRSPSDRITDNQSRNPRLNVADSVKRMISIGFVTPKAIMRHKYDLALETGEIKEKKNSSSSVKRGDCFQNKVL